MPEKHTIEVDVAGADYVVPAFLAALDDLYCYFEGHVSPHQETCLVDAMRMYADHQGYDNQ